jgi:hypothetical protein
MGMAHQRKAQFAASLLGKETIINGQKKQSFETGLVFGGSVVAFQNRRSF